MDGLPKSQLLQFVERAMVLARRAVPVLDTLFAEAIHPPPARRLAPSEGEEDGYVP